MRLETIPKTTILFLSAPPHPAPRSLKGILYKRAYSPDRLNVVFALSAVGHNSLDQLVVSRERGLVPWIRRYYHHLMIIKI